MAQHPSDQDGSPPGPAAGKRLARRRALLVHPLLFAAFPVLFLWAHNLQEGVTLGDAVRLLAMVIGGAAALWLLGALVLRSPSRSALAVSILVVMFFSYGYLYQGLSGVRVGGLRLGSNPILLPFWGALAAVGIVLAVRGGSWLGGLTQGLNVVAAGLVVLNVVSIVSFQVGPNASGAQFLEQSDVQLPARLLRPPPAHRPDIYYIVLDEYAGAEALLDDFHYDNSPFLDFLKNRGFAVPSDSLTNYPRTELSVASSLNLEYVNFLTQEAGPDTKDETPLIKMMQDNQVGTIMESLGYDYIQIGSYWLATSSSPIADVNVRYGGMSRFARLLYRSTALSPLATDDVRHQKWKRVQFQFSALSRLQRFTGPRFVFAHILCPHNPLVFGRDGHFVSTEEEASHPEAVDYVNQLVYVNDQVEKVVRTLLARPVDERPVIIIQSDEGPYPGSPHDWTHPVAANLKRKFGILNALYFPGIAHTGVYPTITPVNTFRLLLDRYFGAGVPLLPDREYLFLNLAHLYDFRDVSHPPARTLEEKFALLNAYYLPGVSQTHLYPTITPVNSFRVVLNDYFNAGLPLLPDRAYTFKSLKNILRIHGRDEARPAAGGTADAGRVAPVVRGGTGPGRGVRPSVPSAASPACRSGGRAWDSPCSSPRPRRSRTW